MDYIRILRDIISIDTSEPSGVNCGRAIDYLRPLFAQVGFTTEVVHIPKEYAEGKQGRVALLCHRRQQNKPRLIFYSHIDVVPAEGWNAFTPWVEDRRIFGRGASDMKGAIVALLSGLEALQGKPLQYDISVMVTTDEEIGQAAQLRYLRQFLEPVSGASLFSLDSGFGYVTIANLGVLQTDIVVRGKSVHSGLAHLGKNAVEQANILVQRLLELKRNVLQRKSCIMVHPDTGLTTMEARLNINKMVGGLQINVVPGECVISLDRRLIPEENIENAEKELMDTLSSVERVDWEIERIFRVPTVPPCQGPVVDKLSGIIEGVTGHSGKFGEMVSGDMPYIATAEWGAREFGLGTIRAECNIHGKYEFVYRDDIENLARIITMFLLSQ